MRNLIYKITEYAHIRLIIMLIVVFSMFFTLVVKLFDLQIKQGDYYNKEVKGTTLRDIVVEAPRGTIYDRYGRPLAVNTSAFTVNLDPSVTVENLNEVLGNLVELLENNNEEITIELPISSTLPHVFLFDGSTSQEKRWKTDMGLDEDLSANDAFYKLRLLFDIDYDMSDEDAAKILGLRCALYQKRFSKYVPISVAGNVSDATVTTLQEQKSNFSGVYVDVESLRTYPEGKYFSHLLGYIGNITETELSAYAEKGYTSTDIIGKDGMEKAMEAELNGIDGMEYVEVDSLGRRINTIESETIDPIPGDKVFLTVDSDLQKATYDALQEALRDAQISRLTGASKDYTYNIKQVLESMIESDNIRLKDIMESKEGSTQFKIKQYILSVDETAVENDDLARQLIIDGLDKGKVTGSQLILTMHEQGTITGDENFVNRVRNGNISALQVILDKLRSGEITPQMTAMDPSTGSVVISDIYSGDVLSAVTYPSYDNNELVNNFNNDYYRRLQNDPLTPMLNRPFMEPRAPGSTFKMITAIAGLEEGLIGPGTTIHDKGTFKDAGRPYARCWIGSGSGSHGSINVSHALEVSCNYFFYTLSYNMGNSKNNSTARGIATLNKYMTAFGLNDKTGVEIYELYNSMKNYPSNISSPEYKEYIYRARNPEVSDSEVQWRDGDTIRTAIGQSFNNYTSAILTKYIATLANGGTRYSMHFLDKVTSYKGDAVKDYEPIVEQELDIKDRNLNAVYEGMLMVTKGSKGTLRNAFADFPVEVAAKSGTAQEASYRSEHTIFVAYAPYDDPQIAITVLIPYGNDTTSPAPKVAKVAIAEYLDINAEPEKSSYNTLTK